MKKKIFLIALAACLITLSIAGTSLAYFTDTDAKTNVFTAGNVYIELTSSEEDTRLYPGQAYAKPSTIANVGTEDAYVGITIDVPTTNPAMVMNDIKTIFTLVGDNASNFTVRYATTTNGYTIYVVATEKVQKNASVTVPVQVYAPATWGNAEMASFKDLRTTVTAYAVQTVGFADAAVALTTAFPAWAGYAAATTADVSTEDENAVSAEDENAVSAEEENANPEQ